MSKIIDVVLRTAQSGQYAGSTFVCAILAGMPIFRISVKKPDGTGGNPYLQIPKVSIPLYGTTLEQARLFMVGQSLPYAVVRKDVPEYEWTPPNSKTPIKLHHTYECIGVPSAEPVLEEQ